MKAELLLELALVILLTWDLIRSLVQGSAAKKRTLEMQRHMMTHFPPQFNLSIKSADGVIEFQDTKQVDTVADVIKEITSATEVLVLDKKKNVIIQINNTPDSKFEVKKKFGSS